MNCMALSRYLKDFEVNPSLSIKVYNATFLLTYSTKLLYKSARDFCKMVVIFPRKVLAPKHNGVN